jgi:hypothetical protein
MEPVHKKPKLDNVKRFVYRTSQVEYSSYEDPETGIWGMTYKFTPTNTQ